MWKAISVLSWLIDRLVEGYLEWVRLEAGLADGDKTLLGDEYGESNEPTVGICPEDDKWVFLFSVGDLGDESEKGGEGTKTFQRQVVAPHNTRYIKDVEHCLKAVLVNSAEPLL